MTPKKNKTSRVTVRMDTLLLEKLRYIAWHNDRYVYKELERLVRSYVENFEKQHGPIVTDE